VPVCVIDAPMMPTGLPLSTCGLRDAQSMAFLVTAGTP
jgi:hypothetical protein